MTPPPPLSGSVLQNCVAETFVVLLCLPAPGNKTGLNGLTGCENFISMRNVHFLPQLSVYIHQ